METEITQNVLSNGLPKWPALAVEGKPVTREQAAEIIIRTDPWCFSCNDRNWERELWEAIGVKVGQYGSPENWEEQEAAMQKHRVLRIEYLHNSRIASAYVGGPHGWCNWDGTIGCNGYNIGKWPSCEAVYREWQTIAEAFPFLELRSQLFNGENCEDHAVPVIEFQLCGGNVLALEPRAPMRLGGGLTESDILSVIYSPANIRERGCTIEQFKNAARVAEKGAQQ